MIDLDRLSPPELLALHARVGERLRESGVTRSANNPTGDLAEYLFCKAFGWQRANPNQAAADAKSADGKTLFQIKGRRWTRKNKSRQLGALRRLPDGGFHFLAAVLFNPDYSVDRAAIIPHALVHAKSTPDAYSNSWRFMLHDAVWTWEDVQDVTERLRAVTL